MREKDGQAFLFVLNHRDEAVRVNLGRRQGTDLLTQQRCKGKVSLPPRGVAVIALT